jgi:hypothetical protein
MEFEKKFKETEIYKKLINDYDVVTFDERYRYDDVKGTPRKWFGCNNRKTIFSAVPFYYIQYLTKHNPLTIHDIGCGWNIFKKYIPNIIGIAGENPEDTDYHGDIHGFVDCDYIQQHQNYFESVFSINALHFVHLSKIRQRILDIVSMISPGGRIFLSLNLARMIERDSNFSDWRSKDINFIEEWIRQQLNNMPFTYEVFDLNLSNPDDWMDGNIRMVICNKIT